MSCLALASKVLVIIMISWFRSRRVQRDLRAVLGLGQRGPGGNGRERMLSRLKSYSCPHLALSSCQTIQVRKNISKEKSLENIL